MKAETVALSEDQRKALRWKVWDIAHRVVQEIENGTMDEERIADFEWAVDAWMSLKGRGLCFIFPLHWEKLKRINGGRAGIPTMIHDGLDCLASEEFWAEEGEDSD